MDKSIFLTTCGRCGTIWAKIIMCQALGFKEELPDMTPYKQESYKRIYAYPPAIIEKEKTDPGGSVYSGHIPIVLLFFMPQYVNLIAMIRDPRDVAVSGAYYNAMKGVISKEDVHSNIINNLHTGHIFSILYSFAAQKDFIPYRFLKYEDMMSDTKKCMSNLLDSMGYTYSSGQFESAIRNCEFKTMSGGREAGNENVNNYFRKGVIGDWKNHLTPQENKRFIDRHGKLMEALGYSTSDI